MIINIEQDGNTVYISYINTEGERKIKSLIIPEKDFYKWCYNNKKPHELYKSWDGKNINKTKSKYLDKFRIKEFILKQPDVIKNDIFSAHMPKLSFFDIEVEVKDEFPKPEEAKNKITTIAVTQGNNVQLLAIKDIPKQKQQSIHKKVEKHMVDYYKNINFEFIFFQTETEMIKYFFKLLRKMDFLLGWNSINFDWQYIHNRAKRLRIKINEASPTLKTYKKKNIEYPMHVGMADYLEIFKKWDRSMQVKESYGLDYIAKELLGISKVKYNGSIQKMYETDYEKYLYYNVIDTLLVELIHNKVQTFKMYSLLSSLTKIEHHMVYSPIAMVTSVMQDVLLNYNKVLVDTNEQGVRGQFMGGFVLEPLRHISKELASCDFASMYPRIMMQWNISTETLIGKFKDKEKLDKYKKLGKFITASGSVFDNEKDGIFKIILEDFYGRRKNTKKMMQEADKEIYKLEQYLKINK